MSRVGQLDVCAIGDYQDKRYSSIINESVLEELEDIVQCDKPLDYMVFKELSELVDITRLQAMKDVALAKEKGVVEDSVIPMKDVQLKKKAGSSWNIYRRANHLFHTVFAREIDRCRENMFKPDLRVA